MRVLLINNHCITDPTAGVTQSLRTLMVWLAEAGHPCQILTTSRFEASTLTVADVEFSVAGVPVRLVVTRHHDQRRPNQAESRRYLDAFQQLLDTFQPDCLIACNSHPMVLEAMGRAKRQGIVTVFALRGYGYRAHDLRDADHVFTCSQFLTDHYRGYGIASTPITPPIEWASVEGAVSARRFVTFVHPAPHKGLVFFERLAEVLLEQRPDIPLLVVESGCRLASRLPNVTTMPAVSQASEFFAKTRILLVPSVWPEPFGRVAAEALIAGVPVIVSDRGALPSVAGTAGSVCAVPDWMTARTVRRPDAGEVCLWFDAVCQLWDDPSLYAASSAQGQARADQCYTEDRIRQQHLKYFEALS